MIAHPRVLVCAGALASGCVTLDLDPPPAPVREPPVVLPRDCTVPKPYRISDRRLIVDGDLIVGKASELAEDCAAGRPWRGPDATSGSRRGHAISGAQYRWPDSTVPYLIDGNLNDAARVLNAMEHWRNVTPINFVPRGANDADYVFITNGDSCHSDVGREGGVQYINLTSEKTPGQIVGTSFSSTGDVYTWYDDHRVTAGDYRHLDSERAQYAYVLPHKPSGLRYQPSEIVGMAIAKTTDHVYVWFDDGKMSAGTSSDLDAYIALRDYDPPDGADHDDIVEIDIAANDHVYTWVRDRVGNFNTVSIGTSTNLDQYAGPTQFTRADGEGIATIRGMGIEMATGRTYTWHSSGNVTIGNVFDLDVYAGPASFDTPYHCSEASVIHELGHTIGLRHEQQRCDRDSHLTIYLNSVEDDKEGNFTKLCAGNLPYGDYNHDSRMHYASTAFSIDGSPTLLHNVPAGDPVGGVVDMAISSTNWVYTWWTDYTVTAGRVDDLELFRSRRTFTLPAPYTWGQITGIAIDKNTDRVHTFMTDGKYMIGTSTTLDYYQGPTNYSVLPHSTSDIVAIDIASTNHRYVWYRDAPLEVSHSTVPMNMGANSTGYSVAANKSVSQVLGIAISPTDQVITWYSNGEYSIGSTTDLDSIPPIATFSAKKSLVVSSPVLNAGDISTVIQLYAQ